MHIQSSYSEYTPLVITTHHPNQLVQKKKIPRRFEEKWASHQECKDIIRHAWENATPTGSPMFYLFEKIIRLAFIGWPRTAFGNAKTKLQDKHKALDDLVSSNRPNNLATIKKLKGKINELLYQKELFWRQWSRSIWLKAGNKNTRYFHQRVSQRHQKNHISGIFDAHETWCTSEDDIYTIAEDYLQQLFSAIATNNMEMVLASLDRFVTLAMNSTLLQDYTAEEVKHALFQCIHQNHQALTTCPLFSSRSIGTLWVKMSLKQCSQHYVAFEVLHRIRNKHKGKIGQMAVTLDISKAYDRVN